MRYVATCPHCGKLFEAEVPERWMTREEIADELKVSRSTIERWRRDGMPSQLWGPKQGTRRYEYGACMEWARRQGEADV